MESVAQGFLPLFPKVHRKYDLPSSTFFGMGLFCAMIVADMKNSIGDLSLSLVIEDLSQNNKKIFLQKY